MAPAAKRRKRNIVDDDSEADEKATPSKNNTLARFLVVSPSPNAANARPSTASPSPIRKKNTRATASSLPVPAPSLLTRGRATKPPAKSPSTSPDKSRSKRPKLEDKGKTADLLTLFSKQAQKSELQGQTNGRKTSPAIDFDDLISDPISEDDEVALHKTAVSSIVGRTAQKRFKETSQTGQSGSAASTRFLNPPRPPVPGNINDDTRPWSERFAPINLDELAVHKKKVADVRKWLEDVMTGRMRQRLLVLKGAAGTGKTTTVQLLARELRCDVLEWRNPASTFGSTAGYRSASAQFDEFLGRGGRFGQLDMDDEPTAPSSTSAGTSHDGTRRIILVEEFPNTFARSSTALTSFRAAISQFLAANTPSLSVFGQASAADPIIPVVMVISETLLTTASASADSFTAHRLLGPEILRHPGTGLIEFNPIAPSLLAKAMEVIVQKEARKSGRRRTPGPLVLKRLGEIGDIRSAISSLEFLCVKGDDDTDWGAKVAFTKSKRGAKETPALTRGEQDSLELVTQREASLGIFHAVGKAVYNKRDELPYAANSASALAEDLPEFIKDKARPKPSQVSVDTLIDETGTDTSTFISALHENYALSCEAGPADPNSSVDYINECIEYLSEADLLAPSWDIFFGGKGYPGGSFGKDSSSHVVRQDEMAFQVAVRGLLFSLPHPVRRQSHPTGGGRGGGDTFKMFFPTSIKLWRAKEEIGDMVDMWAAKLLGGEDVGLGVPSNPSGMTNGSAAFKQQRTGARGVSDWAANQKNLSSIPAKDQSKTEDDEPATTFLSLGSAARKEMILERLPYMAHIARRKRCTFGSLKSKDLDKMVSFSGIGPPKTDDSEDDDDDNDSPAGEAWATDKPTDESAPRRKSLGAILRRKKDRVEDPISASLPVQSLVLSDDDIEDD